MLGFVDHQNSTSLLAFTSSPTLVNKGIARVLPVPLLDPPRACPVCHTRFPSTSWAPRTRCWAVWAPSRRQDRVIR